MNTPKLTINSIVSIQDQNSNRIIQIAQPQSEKEKLGLLDMNQVTPKASSNSNESTSPKNEFKTKLTLIAQQSKKHDKDELDMEQLIKFQQLLQNSQQFTDTEYLYLKEDIKKSKEREKLKQDGANNEFNPSTNNFFEQFRFRYFFEFFCYHFVYFILLGPLAIPLINLGGKALSRNMQFSGISWFSIQQLIIYLLNISAFAVFYTNKCDVVTFQVEMINIIAIMFTRCVVIACKYATYDRKKMEYLRNNILNKEQRISELFFGGWISQTPLIIHRSVLQCQKAFNIDPSLFYIQFMVTPEQKTDIRLKQHQDILKQVRDNDEFCQRIPPPVVRPKKEKQEKIYFGYEILKDLIDSYQQKHRKFRKFLIISAIIFSSIRALIPLGFHIYNNPRYPYKHSYEYFICVVSLFQVFNMFLFFCMQTMLGYFDATRKLFMQRQLSFMIAPRKLKNLDMEKILPTVDIFNSYTIKGWTLIRKVCMEYGKAYSLRVQGLYTFLGVWTITSVIILILSAFKIVNSFERIFVVQLYIDTIVSLVLLFAFILVGAQINDVFNLQESILNSNKTIISDLGLIINGFLNEKYHSENFIYTKALEKLLEQEQESPEEKIQSLLQHYDFHINELIYDKNHNPFTLFGLKVTFVMLQSTIVAIGSVIATVLSQLTKKH
ncbi:hypothetical protein ABPG74_017146 [Tetrahymena malaccensis]